MTVCQFFLEGRCRFGQNCRNEHSYNTDDRNNRAPTNTQQLKNLIRQIVCEVMIAEKGGQWPLSCFAPAKEGPNIPDWEDYSPEEIRWKMYDARRNGTLSQCINEVNQLYCEAEKRRNDLKQPTMEKIGVLVNVLKGKKDQPTTGNLFASSLNVQNTNTIFGSPNGNQSIFGSPPQTGTNIFGGLPQTSTQGSIFGSGATGFAKQSVFGGSNVPENNSQSIFSNSQSSSQNIFSSSPSALVQNQSIFPSNQSPLGAGSSNTNLTNFSAPAAPPIFAAQNMLFKPTDKSNQDKSSIFGGTQIDIFKGQNSFTKCNENLTFDALKGNPFAGQAQGNFSVNNFGNNQSNVIDQSVYSNKEDLSSDELEAFAMPTFKFGKIPLKPPPLESCK